MINPKSKIQNPKSHWLLLFLWLAIGLGLRLTNLASKSPWTDEFSTLVFSLGNSFRTVPLDRAIALDVLLQPLQLNLEAGAREVVQRLLSESNHPPLYFVLAHWWMDLFSPDGGLVSLGVARSLPALLGAASIPAIFGLGWLAFRSQLVAHLAAAMMAVSPYGIFLAQEARHYSLSILWVIASLACLVVAIQNIQRQTSLPVWLGTIWVIINTLGIATHYFFVLTLCAEAIVLIGFWILDFRFSINLRSCIILNNPEAEPPNPRSQAQPGNEKENSGLLPLVKNGARCEINRKSSSVAARSAIQNLKFLTAVAVGTLAGGLIWFPVIQHGYGSELTEWIKNSDRVGLEWIAPIFQALAAWITMLSLLPVEASALPVVIVSGLAMGVFFVWAIPIGVRGIKVQMQQPNSRRAILTLGGFVLGAIAIFFLITYGFGIDLTRGARYNFVYFPAVIVLIGASLAVIWNSGEVRINNEWESRKNTPFHSFRKSGKKAVILILLMGFISGITVVWNLGYQKYYRPDLLVQLIQQTSQAPVLIATTHKTHVQTGEFMGIAWEFKRLLGANVSTFPEFLLAHQERKGSRQATATLQKTLQEFPHPLNLWLVNFYAPVELEAQNCLPKAQPFPAVDGYDYRVYQCN